MSVALVLCLLTTSSLVTAHHGPGDHNCADFATWEAAQTFYLTQGGPADDPHRLDADGDGIACEGLPNAPQNPATATARVGTTATVPPASRTPTPSSSTPTPSPSRTTTSAPTQSPSRTPTTSTTGTATVPGTATRVPASQVCLAYLYDGDLGTALSYQALLLSAGIRADLIHRSLLFGTDFSRYSAVLIGPETGDKNLWGDAQLKPANHVTGSDRPILGLGWGGSRFFDVIDLDMSWTQGVTGSARDVFVVEPTHAMWLAPQSIPIPPDRIVRLYEIAGPSIAIHSADAAPHLSRTARSTDNTVRYPIVGQYAKHWLWGFNNGPDTMTTIGRQAFLNLIQALPNVACSAGAPPPLVAPSTATATRTATGTPSPASTSTVRPTSPTPTVTPVHPDGPGGRSLTINSTDGALRWSPGGFQTGYAVARWIPDGETTILPANGSPLPANSTGFIDPSGPLDPVKCYVVMPLGGTPPSLDSTLGLSDLLCRVDGAVGATIAPFELRLDDSTTAKLAWAAFGALSPNRLVILPLDGGEPQTLPIDTMAIAITFETKGHPTCFQLQSAPGEEVVGATDILCGVPGVSTFGSLGRTHTPAVTRFPDDFPRFAPSRVR